MTIEKVIQYVLHTPYNTNRAILTSILEQLIIYYGGNPNKPGGSIPEEPNTQIIYDGGMEN